jgi:hypothetical protein
MAVEAKRGCGYRKVGGLYLVGGGLSASCDRMPFPLDRCRTCGGGIKFTRGPQWLQPDFFSVHDELPARIPPPGESRKPGQFFTCQDESVCPVCRNSDRDDFGPHLLLWIGRAHYTPEAYLEEGRKLGVSRRLSAMPKGLILGETWVLLAHLDAVPARIGDDGRAICSNCEEDHSDHADLRCPVSSKESFYSVKQTPGIFCAFVPRAVELILKQSDATPERVEKEAKRGVTVVAVPDDDRDHQGSVWDGKDEEDSQPELPGVSP